MYRIWPDPDPNPLSDAALTALYEPAGPGVRMNFVTSVDGAVEVEGRSAGEYLKGGRWIEIATGFLTVGRRASDHLVVKKKKALDRYRYSVERCLALPRGEPDFEDPVLARQRDGLSEPGSCCQICSSIRSLRRSSRIRPCKRQQDPDGAKGGNRKVPRITAELGLDGSPQRPPPLE